MTPSVLRTTPPTTQGEIDILPYEIGEVSRTDGGILLTLRGNHG